MEVLRERREDAQELPRARGVVHLQLDRVEERVGELHEAQVLDDLRAVGRVPEDRVPRHREVAADLVRAARLDPDGEVRGLRVRAEAVDLRERAAAVERQVDRRGGGVPAAVHDRAVRLRDAVFLEDGDDGRVRRGGLGEENAARGVAVEAVRGAQVRVAGLLAQVCERD